jgi:uncharacterized protein YqgV (UPF0045/DUF77 family)
LKIFDKRKEDTMFRKPLLGIDNSQSVSVQLSIYPIGDADVSRAIEQALDILKEFGLSPKLGPMSTLVHGKTDKIFGAIEKVYRVSANEFRIVMVATFSNTAPDF